MVDFSVYTPFSFTLCGFFCCCLLVILDVCYELSVSKLKDQGWSVKENVKAIVHFH